MKDASPIARFWAEFRESRTAVIALAVVVLTIGIALLAPLVAKAAAEGDREASTILADAGHSLGLVGLGVIRQLFEPGEPVEVYRTGGVFNIGAPVIDELDRTLQAGWPGAVSRAPRFPPAVGGLILAARSLGIEPDDAWLAKIAATLPQ